jgi:hypothetical protein
MELLPDELYLQLEIQDPYGPHLNGRELPDTEIKVWLKYFLTGGSWTWYAVSASRDPDTGDVQFFGLVVGLETEFGYFWLSEIKAVSNAFGLGVERDLYWDPITLAELKGRLGL